MGEPGDYGTEVKLLAVTRVTNLACPEPPYGEGLIEYAGRLCYSSEDKVGTRPGWIQERIKDGHESIIEHASATFYIRCSRAVTHELVRHRLASYSQRSQRYVDESVPKFITPPELKAPVEMHYRDRPIAKYQNQRTIASYFNNAIKQSWEAYEGLIRSGIKREIARYVLPNACETQIVVTMNFRELRHFIKLRTSKRALPEMREVAGKVRDICKQIAPQVFQDL